MARTKTTAETFAASSLALSGGRISLTKFLRKYPQDSTVTAILKKRYGSKFYTEEEWFAIIDEILNGKIS